RWGGVNGALALIVQTQRFKAAVDVGGMTNLVDLYLQQGEVSLGRPTSDGMDEIEHYIGGTPWQFRDRYLENSPLFYLDRVVTPLLMMQSGEGGRIPGFSGDQAFIALRKLGKEAEYAK